MSFFEAAVPIHVAERCNIRLWVSALTIWVITLIRYICRKD